MQHRPFLNSRRSGGANYLLTGLQTWLILGVLAYFGRGMFGIFLPGPGNQNTYREVGKYVGVQVSTVPTVSGSFAIGVPTVAPSPTPIVVVINVVTPVARTAGVGVTPIPDDGREYDVGYSYYDPSLGGINCHSANWDGSKCADTTASGIKWSDYMGRGVAMAPSWLAQLGYGTVIYVTSPTVLVGYYTVVDICCGCEATNWADGRFRMDFLDVSQKLQWAYPVKFFFVSRTDKVDHMSTKVCYAGG